MNIPARVALPVGFAAACAFAVLGLLWWQLYSATQALTSPAQEPENQTPAISTIAVPETPMDPRDRALLHLRQGDVLALRGEWAAAQQEYEASVNAGGGLPALRKLAQAQLQRRNMEGARSTIRALRAAGARTEDLLLLESIVELRSGELVRARDLLTNAPDSPQKHYGLALLSIVEGNHQAAQQALALVIEGWEPVLRSYARSLQAAYDEFALFPESTNAHLITLLSRALAQVHECELALPLLVQVTQAHADYRDAWIVQGYCELTTERADAALLSLEHAYTLDPQKPEIQYFLGRTYAARGEYGNAITFYEYALQNGFQPQSEVRFLMAQAALASGDTLQALSQYDILTQAPDANLDAFVGYVATARVAQNAEQAYVKAQQAVQKFPEEAKAWELLGLAAADAGRKEEAIQALEKALANDPFLTEAKGKLEELRQH